MTQNGAHASKLTVAGVDYRVRRSFDLMVRIEEEFGELGAFIFHCEKRRLPAVDLAKLYRIVLAKPEDAEAPSIEAIQDHIAAVAPATAFKTIFAIVNALWLGDELYMRLLAEQTAGNLPSPQAGADSNGASGSAPPPASAGPRTSSGAPPSMS